MRAQDSKGKGREERNTIDWLPILESHACYWEPIWLFLIHGARLLLSSGTFSSSFIMVFSLPNHSPISYTIDQSVDGEWKGRPLLKKTESQTISGEEDKTSD